MTPDPAPPPARRLPWRSARVGWAFAALFLLAGVPPFLRMSPWCDLTLYDVAARNVMTGGVHYRDVFDTNLPGFVWLLVLIRRAFGSGLEAVLAVDLLVVAGIVAYLARFARRAGADPGAVAWMVAGAAFFYPFTTEFNHAQRDVWMLLPALAATWLRLRRAGEGRLGFWPPAWEGVIWGCAIWIKPHALIPAVGVWVASARRLTAGSDRPWRAAMRDGFAYVAGGGVVGLLGVVWILATGTWQPFLDVFRKWNPSYTQGMWEQLPWRLNAEFAYFPPYSLLLPLPLVAAAANLIEARPFGLRWGFARRAGESLRGTAVGRWLWWAWGYLYAPAATEDVRFARGVLATLFLAWAFQAAFFQRMFHYVHVPEILLMLAVAAANRWAVAAVGMGYAAVCAGVWLAADQAPALGKELKVPVWSWTDHWVLLPRHPLAMPERLARWPDCFRLGLTGREYRERQEAVALFGGTFASVDPVGIGEVADYLRSVGAKEGEVLCWHDSPHAVYLELGHHPPFRFMHLSTPMLSEENYERMKIELVKVMRRTDPKVKYAVTDLKRAWMHCPDEIRDRVTEPGPGGGDLFPPRTPRGSRDVFPMYEPAVFRTDGGRGRYIVHRIERGIGPYDSCTVPQFPDD